LFVVMRLLLVLSVAVFGAAPRLRGGWGGRQRLGGGRVGGAEAGHVCLHQELRRQGLERLGFSSITPMRPDSHSGPSPSVPIFLIATSPFLDSWVMVVVAMSSSKGIFIILPPCTHINILFFTTKAQILP
jgi:hypothetical protein